MGSWGFEPWENDGAADWFHFLHDETGLRDYVVDTIKRGAKHGAHGLTISWHWEEVRAAAFVMQQLAKTYMWPVRTLDSDIKFAIKELEKIIHLIQAKNFRSQSDIDLYVGAIEKQIRELKKNRPRLR